MTRQEFTPRPWQPPMIEHVIEVPKGALWAGMGLGKTTGVMTALDYMLLAGEITSPILVVGPLRVVTSTWPDEAVKWAHLRHIEVIPITGTAAARMAALKRALQHGNASVYTINYENLVWLEKALAELRVTWPFATIVPDESTKLKGLRISEQTSSTGKKFLKGQGGARAKSLAKVAHRHASRIIELTGTPAPNGLKDLWGQIWYLDGGERLGRTHTAFMQRYFRTGYDGHTIEPLPHTDAHIHAALADICLTLDIADYMTLDKPIVQPVYVDLPPKARQLYRALEKEMFFRIQEHEVEAFNAAALTQKCLQLANGAVYVDPVADGEEHPKSKMYVEVHDAKIQALEDIINDAGGMPVLVAYHFKSDLARLLKAFPQGRWLDDDPATIRDWNAGKIPVLFAHPASAGHGLNLQDGGNIIVFFGHWWNLEEFLQIIERIGPTRQMQAGHNRAVFIYHLIARDTIDETVMARRDNKRGVQDLLLEAMKRKGGGGL